MEHYINPANHVPVFQDPDLMIFFKGTVNNSDKSYSVDVSRVSRSHAQDGHHARIW